MIAFLKQKAVRSFGIKFLTADIYFLVFFSSIAAAMNPLKRG